MEMIVTRDPAAPHRIEPYAIEHYTDYVKALRAIGGRLEQPIEVRWRSAAGAEKRVGETIVRRPPARSYVWSLVWFLQEMMIFAVVARAFWACPHDASARRTEARIFAKLAAWPNCPLSWLLKVPIRRRLHG